MAGEYRVDLPGDGPSACCRQLSDGAVMARKPKPPPKPIVVVYFVDDAGISSFIDDVGIVSFADDLGRVLG